MYKTGANCPLSSFLDAIFVVTLGKPVALYLGTTQPSSEQLPKNKEIFDEHIFDFFFKKTHITINLKKASTCTCLLQPCILLPVRKQHNKKNTYFI